MSAEPCPTAVSLNLQLERKIELEIWSGELLA